MSEPDTKPLNFRQDTLDEAYRSLFRGTPKEAAERAYKSGGPPVEELEQRIIAFRLEHTKKKADPTPMRTGLHHK